MCENEHLPQDLALIIPYPPSLCVQGPITQKLLELFFPIFLLLRFWWKYLVLSQLKICRPPPLEVTKLEYRMPNVPQYMKNNLPILRFLIFEIWLIMYSKIMENWDFKFFLWTWFGKKNLRSDRYFCPKSSTIFWNEWKINFPILVILSFWYMVVQIS